MSQDHDAGRPQAAEDAPHGRVGEPRERAGRAHGNRQPPVPAPEDAPHSRLMSLFDRFAHQVTRRTGSPLAFGLAVIAIVVWAATGPLFGFSETWQLVVNTGTTIVTFLMVFLIQQNQNKDSRAVHVKLDALILAMRGASDKLIDIENLDEEDLQKVAKYYADLATKARRKAGEMAGGEP